MRHIWFSGLVFAFATACQPKVTAVTVVPDQVQLSSENKSTTVTVNAADEKGRPVEKVQVMWTSSDDKVATVDAAGKITAVGSGTAQITAKVGEIAGVAALKVNLITAAKIEPATVKVQVGGAPVQVELKMVNEKGEVSAATDKIEWSVSDAAIATISPEGAVSAVAAGEVTVKGKSGAYEASAQVTVEAAAPVDGAAPAIQ